MSRLVLVTVLGVILAVAMIALRWRRRMTKAIPPWDNDALSRFFADAEYNDRATSLNYPSVYVLLQETNAAMESVEKALEHDSNQGLIIPRFLIVRARAAFLGAIRLAMSGELPEAYAVLRLAIEQSWYALHIAKDPAPPKRSTVWLCRNDNDAAKAACKQEFTVKNVRTTHEQADPDTAKQLHSLYEVMIDFGAHPNQFGTLAAARKGAETDKQVTYQVGILHPVPVPQLMTIRLAVAVAVGSLKIAQHVYPQKLQATDINSRISDLVVKLNEVFKSWVPK